MDAKTRGHACVIDRSPQLGAEAGRDKKDLQDRGDEAADGDDEEAIDANANAMKLDATAQPIGQFVAIILVASILGGAYAQLKRRAIGIGSTPAGQANRRKLENGERWISIANVVAIGGLLTGIAFSCVLKREKLFRHFLQLFGFLLALWVN